MKSVGRWLVVVVAVTLVAGCSAGSSTPPPKDAGRTPSAPKVEKPLATAVFEEHPCQALKASDTPGLDPALNVTSETSADSRTSFARQCESRSDAQKLSLSLAWIAKAEGLEPTYRSRKDGDTFQPLEIGGYPAVVTYSPEEDGGDNCNIIVGTSDTKAFLIAARTGKNPSKACDLARRAAALALKTMAGTP